MINQYISKTHVMSRMLNSALGKLFDDYVSYLHQNGYTKNTIPAYCLALEHFGQWMRINSLSISDINHQTINKFIKKHLPKCKCSKHCTKDIKTIRASLKQLLIVLIHKNIYIADNDQKEEDFVTKFLKEYEAYLIKICGISENTRIYRKRYIKKFIISINLTQISDINNIKTKSVISFIKQYAH